MRLPSVLVAFALAACSGYDAALPDGGRGRVSCSASSTKASVTVLDKADVPQPGAGVVVSYLSSGEELVLETNGGGVVLIEDKGAGLVRVQAQYNDLQSEFAELTFVGGECSHSVSPPSVTLRLH
jgi:hypothetical protein